MLDFKKLAQLAVAVTLAALVVLCPIDARATVPGTVSVEGLLSATSGGPASDGNYVVQFALFAEEKGGNPLWSDGPVAIAVKGGLWTYVLGSQVPLTPQVVGGPALWLSLQVAQDAELPRQPVGSGFFAQRAAIAEAMACSGCIVASHLDPGVLAGYVKAASLAKIATSGSFSDLSGGPDLSAYVKANSLHKVAGTGVYADLSGKPTVPKLGETCGTGLVLRGFGADGSLDCVPGFDPKNLPPDAIDEVSNGLIFNQFVEAVPGKADTPIVDGLLAGTSDVLEVPDIGLIQGVWINVDLTNSDVSKIEILLYAPGNAQPYALYKGTKAGSVLKASFNKDTPLAVGDLNKDWVGKNPKGLWSLLVRDLAQGSGGVNDGKFTWSIQLQTLSTKKIEVKGDLLVQGAFKFGESATPPVACSAATQGYAYMEPASAALRVCRKGKWNAVLFQECGNGVLEYGEQCDDGSNNADAPNKCRLSCDKPKCGDKIADNATGEQCDDGNGVDNDDCSNSCKSPFPLTAFSVASSAGAWPTAMGTIPAQAGKKIVISKIGICGDSDATSGPNVFSAKGAGLDFTWASGQNQPACTYFLSPTPPKNASRGFTFKAVSHVGNVGEAVSVTWESHIDYDGLYCTDTDELGNVYNDVGGSSVRVWVLYQYQ